MTLATFLYDLREGRNTSMTSPGFVKAAANAYGTAYVTIIPLVLGLETTVVLQSHLLNPPSQPGLARRIDMLHNGRVVANLNIAMPDDLSRSLEGIAAAQHKSVTELAIESLRSLVEGGSHDRSGSAASVLRVMLEPPHLRASDVEELEAAIAASRLLLQTRETFSD